jgi:hypothetical protein
MWNLVKPQRKYERNLASCRGRSRVQSLPPASSTPGLHHCRASWVAVFFSSPSRCSASRTSRSRPRRPSASSPAVLRPRAHDSSELPFGFSPLAKSAAAGRGGPRGAFGWGAAGKLRSVLPAHAAIRTAARNKSPSPVPPNVRFARAVINKFHLPIFNIWGGDFVTD